ncbi:hypothetical protein [Allorhizocola rhizosphaerae]|uniref:hypothetical protein n=1 Tax=Allorhizocola rhizosphaerae TaxID=1872709 RepID=UPI0013C2E9B4|nr:hypothetical protein [Allorhizocola rhizosphaerae]
MKILRLSDDSLTGQDEVCSAAVEHAPAIDALRYEETFQPCRLTPRIVTGARLGYAMQEDSQHIACWRLLSIASRTASTAGCSSPRRDAKVVHWPLPPRERDG